MISEFLKRQFRAWRSNQVGKPTSPIWIDGRESAVHVDLCSGKMQAYVFHDGCGEYYSIIYVSAFCALRLSRKNRGTLLSLRSFPRCAMVLPRLYSMEDARDFVEYVLEGSPDLAHL